MIVRSEHRGCLRQSGVGGPETKTPQKPPGTLDLEGVRDSVVIGVSLTFP